MKKIIVLLVALAMCICVFASAESVPSKTTGDLTNFSITTENAVEGAGMEYIPASAEDTERIDICQKEIEKLMASESITAYFGEVKDAEGNVISLTEVLGTETLNVNEFYPVVAHDYVQEMGKVTIDMIHSTPYEVGEQVVVMIGVVTVAEDGTQTVEWTAFNGVCVESEGGTVIRMELTPEIVTAVQNGLAVHAIVSK